MKKKIKLNLVLCLFVSPIAVQADAWDDTKVLVNKTMFWKDKHLKKVDFQHMYPKKFYKKSYFGFAITAAAIVGAGAFSYFTAGAGAPVAATGVSSVAAAVGGGGVGSYMAGLSTIGSFFGGNAMLGAAILNGISIGVAGGGAATFATMSILYKVGILASITASGLDGVLIFMNPDTKEMEYKVRLIIPENLGSKETRGLVNKISEVNDEISDAREDKDDIKASKLLELKEAYEKQAINLLEKILSKEGNHQEDILVLSTIASNNNQYKLFTRAINKLDVTDLNNKGYIYYLYALKDMYNGKIKEAYSNLDNSIAENKYAIEPILLYINLLGNKNFIQNESKISQLTKSVEDNFDTDKYSTGYSMTSLYYRLGTFYFLNQRYVQAEEFYKKAYDELGLLQKHFFGQQLVNIINMGIANSLYKQKKVSDANELYKNIMEDTKDEDETNQLKSQYIGNTQ